MTILAELLQNIVCLITGLGQHDSLDIGLIDEHAQDVWIRDFELAKNGVHTLGLFARAIVEQVNLACVDCGLGAMKKVGDRW